MARRWLEFLALFAVAPALLAFAPPWAVIPGILAGAGLCLALLWRDPGFDRRALWNAASARQHLPRVLARTLLGWLALAALVLALKPEAFFLFPRARPGLWVLVMIGYPLLSALPQELIYRAFFFHRYATLFPGRAGIAASAVAFGYAHVVLHNLPSVLISTVGGVLFALTYTRSRSTFLCALEHALYGCFVFSVGLGALFYAGGRSLSATFRL